MTALKWDETGTRKYETGVKSCALYPYGTTGYQTGVAWNGITSITESPDGAEPTDLYADDIKYATLRSAETLGGTIEAYTYPDEWAECDGSAEIADGVFIGQQARKMFGLAYKTSIGDDTSSDVTGYKLHIVYSATASPSDRQYETINDSPDAITFSWEYTTTAVAFTTEAFKNYKPTSLITIDSTKVNKSQLETLEATLFGGVGTDPTLPSPDEVLAVFTPSGATGATGSTGA